MALRKIIEQGDECLTKVCRPVEKFDRRLHILLDDMAETLADANGAGLAAPQVGVLRRVCLVLDEESEEFLELINPEIIVQSGEQTGLEGCLSVPGKWGIVTRPNRVRVRAQDRDGAWFEAEAEGLTARAFCHEIEHLDGHLFIEHIDHFLTEEELKEYLEDEENGNVVSWLEDAAAEIRKAFSAGRTPVVVGGSGLYLDNLINGSTPIPEVDPAVRGEALEIVNGEGVGALFERLLAVDPEGAALVNPADATRVRRAFEIFMTTGLSIAEWFKRPMVKKLQIGRAHV